MPKNESIHFDREFIKRENGLVKEEGNTPYGTSENISMDVSLTADKDNLYKADGNLKIGNRTINITSATKVEFGYYLEENDSANSVDVIYHANDTNIITVIIAAVYHKRCIILIVSVPKQCGNGTAVIFFAECIAVR